MNLNEPFIDDNFHVEPIYCATFNLFLLEQSSDKICRETSLGMEHCYIYALGSQNKVLEQVFYELSEICSSVRRFENSDRLLADPGLCDADLFVLEENADVEASSLIEQLKKKKKLKKLRLSQF